MASGDPRIDRRFLSAIWPVTMNQKPPDGSVERRVTLVVMCFTRVNNRVCNLDSSLTLDFHRTLVPILVLGLAARQAKLRGVIVVSVIVINLS